MGRGRSKMKRLQRGQTIVAERERVETDSERLQAQRRAERRRATNLLVTTLILAALGLAFYFGMKQLSLGNRGQVTTVPAYTIKAEVVDEDNRGQISGRVRTYIGQLEQDLADLGWRVSRVTLPTGASRALYVNIDGIEPYFKVNIDRETALVAEDLGRMINYLEANDLHPSYVDLRVAGRAYFQ